MRRLALAVIALALVAGCTTGTQDGSGPAEDRIPGPDDQATETLYLDAEGQLVRQDPTGDPQRVPMGSFYANWTAGDEQPTWTGPGLDQALLVEEATLTFYYTANESATATTGPQGQGFPEFVVYVGTDRAPQGWASVEGPDVVEEGEVVEVTAELSLPTGGLVLSAGHEPIAKIAPVQGQGDEEAQLDLLVNGTSTPSRVVLQGRPVELTHSQARPVLNETGTLSGTVYVTGNQGPTSRNHTVFLPDEATGLAARLERVQGAGVADIDLDAFGPGGDLVARSVTPEPREGVALYEPNLEEAGTGSWTLRVTNVGNAAVQYRLQAWVMEPAGGS